MKMTGMLQRILFTSLFVCLIGSAISLKQTPSIFALFSPVKAATPPQPESVAAPQACPAAVIDGTIGSGSTRIRSAGQPGSRARASRAIAGLTARMPSR